MEQRRDVGNEFDLAARRLEVASEDLDTAKVNLQEKHYRAANRNSRNIAKRSQDLYF